MKKNYRILIFILLLSTSIKAQSRNDAGLQGDAGATSGFFDANVPLNFPHGATSWWHLLDVRHSNTNNNFAMQFAGSFFNQELFFRKTNNDPSTAWSKVLLETSGKVGIGTNNPSNRFEVSGSTFNRAAFVTTENAQTGLMVQRNQNNGAFNTAWELYSPVSSTDLRLFNVDDRITFQSNGNVGIGTTSPTSKFDVKGQFNSYSVGIGQQSITTSSRNFVNFGSNNHATVLISSNLYFDGDDNLKIAKSHPTLAGASILIPGNSQPNQGGIVFYTNQPASVIEDANFNGNMSMIIKNDGNIGIGTITPREKLSVNGNIRAKEIKVETANWPDYVFAKDYKLPPLAETEKHIKEKGHLPGIPSAEEVKANGINIGEMNAKLLKKIEELTLHLIEMKKENKQLNDRVSQLELKCKK